MYSGQRSDGLGKWEDAEFPIVCEDCLGEEIYLRMMKSPFDQACKICLRPFTTFRWRPGGKGKFRTTEICQTCAKLRNACQSCILDLVYHLPIQIRDQINPVGPAGSQPVIVSDVHREYFADQAERQIAEGKASDFGKAPPMPKLVGVARTMAPFFAKMGIDGVAGADSGSFDPENTSLFLGGVGEDLNETDVRNGLRNYAGITRVKLVPKIRAAFVDFDTREHAEAAFTGCGGTVALGAARTIVQVNWSKGKKGGHNHHQQQQHGIPTGTLLPPPPPPGVAPPPGVRGANRPPAHIPAGAAYYPSASGASEGSAPVHFDKK